MRTNLFILQSGKFNAKLDKTKKSVDDYITSATFCKTIQEINDLVTGVTKPVWRDVQDWYMVLYDNEYIDPLLKAILPIELAKSLADSIILYKVDNLRKTTKAPRIFKKDIVLRPNSLLPLRENDIIFMEIPGGWIREHV